MNLYFSVTVPLRSSQSYRFLKEDANQSQREKDRERGRIRSAIMRRERIKPYEPTVQSGLKELEKQRGPDSV